MGKTKSINLVRVMLALFFLFAAILPLVGMFARLFQPCFGGRRSPPRSSRPRARTRSSSPDGDVHLALPRPDHVMGAVSHAYSLQGPPSPSS